MFHSQILQSFPKECYVVAGTASASGLGHEYAHLIQIVLSGFQRRNNLPQCHDGRIARIIVDVPKSFFLRVLGNPRQEHRIVSGPLQNCLEVLEVNRRHLRNQERIPFILHLFRKEFPLIRQSHLTGVYAGFLSLF